MVHPVGVLKVLPNWAGLIRSKHYALGPKGRLYSIHFPRRTRSAKDPNIFHTPLIAGEAADIRPGRHLTSKLKSYFTGLEYCVRIETPGKPVIYVMDNHKMAYFAWHEAAAMGYLQEDATLVHIDRHTDDLMPDTWSDDKALNKVAHFVKNILTNGDFIIPAVAKGLFDKFWLFFSEPEEHYFMFKPGMLAATAREIRLLYGLSLLFYKNDSRANFTQQRSASLVDVVYESQAAKKLAIDIDLDGLVGRETEKTPAPEKINRAVKFLTEISKRAGIVTIATSPGYADQKVVLPLARRLAEAIVN